MRNFLISSKLSANNLDLIRFLLAVAVIYSHCYVICYGKLVDTEPFMILTRNQLDLGGFAVNCFFTISGFLIVRSFERNDGRGYLSNRFLRIFPGFFVAFLISICLVGPLGTINSDHPFGDWSLYFQGLRKKLALLHLATFQKPVSAPCFGTLPLPSMVNEPLWSIHYEVICYGIVPILGMLRIIKRKWLFLLIFLISYTILALQEYAHLFLWETYRGQVISHPALLPRLFTYFFAGAIVYLFRASIPNTKVFIITAAAALLFSMVGYRSVNLILPFANTYLLFFVAYHPRLQFHDFARKGDFSYGMYLYGWPVQQLLLYFLGKQLDPFRLFCLTLPIVYLAAYCSWNLIEKQFIKLKKADWSVPSVVLKNLA